MAEFYGFNPFQLKDDQVLGLYDCLPRLEARRTRRQLQYSDVRLTPDQIYDLVLAETEDPKQAEAAHYQLARAQLLARSNL